MCICVWKDKKCSIGYVYFFIAKVSHEELHLVWGDFIDPESHILEYRLSVGSCKGCSDVLNDVYVGLVKGNFLCSTAKC